MGPFLMTPSTAQNLVLAEGLGMHTFGEIDDKGRPMDRVAWGYESDLMQRLGSGVGRSAHLQSLKMTFHMLEPEFTRAQDKQAPRTVFDFGWLERLELPQLQSFQLTARFFPAFGTDNDLLSEFDKAVDKVGFNLIGAVVYVIGKHTSIQVYRPRKSTGPLEKRSIRRRRREQRHRRRDSEHFQVLVYSR
jgi:hypothetical protein